MSFDKFFNILGMTVVVAGVTTVVMRPNSATIIRSMGEAWSSVLKAASGR